MNTLTGIPIEILFTAVGTLGLIIYADIRWQIRKLSQESANRGKALAVLRTYMRLVCDKLGIPWNGGD